MPAEIQENSFADHEAALDRWLVEHMNPRLKPLLEGHEAKEIRGEIRSLGPKIGNFLAPTPEGRLLLVREAVERSDRRMLQVLSRDTSPVVRFAAFQAADEIDGVIQPKSHHKAMVGYIKWDRARKQGRLEIPKFMKSNSMPPLQF